MLLKLFIILSIFGSSLAFISNPLEGQEFMDKLLNILVDVDMSKDFMKYSVPGEKCLRKCKTDETRVCYFKFNLEYYQILGGACDDCKRGNISNCFHDQCVTGDGYERGFQSVNRKLPGTPIQVCKGDLVVVDVDNEMEGTATTIHWHGFRQHGTPFMDGTPFVSQCPITYGSTFRYTFYAEDLGTHFYHSHSGLHKSNGIHGPLIVRNENDNPELYDEDPDNFHILIADWMHVYSEQYFPGLSSRLSLFKSTLINGRGQFMNRTSLEYNRTPVTIFNVIRNLRYRFRVINAASNVCPFLVQIESHEFEVIASDGSTFRPVKADSLFIISGERYDFVVTTNQKQIRDYWIRIRALTPCNLIESFGILRYHKQKIPGNAKNFDFNSRIPPKLEEKYPEDFTFNSPQSGIGMSVIQAESYKNDQKVIRAKADHSFKLFLGTPVLNNQELFTGNNTIKFMATSTTESFNNIAVFNNISIIFPDFTLLSQPENIDEKVFCDFQHLHEENRIGNSSVYQCLHRLKVKLGSIVELLIYDVEDSRIHPFHLHGHKFYVMDMANFDEILPHEKIIDEDIPKDRSLKNENPPFKDTISIPNPGYVRLKFHADNPGFWIGHCHFDWHLGIGMAVIFQVGELEEMPKRPENFETCGSYRPNRL